MCEDIDSIVRNLQDAGCSDECIEKFLSQLKDGKKKQCEKILGSHRRELLENLHQQQRKIDCLDYLMYKMKK